MRLEGKTAIITGAGSGIGQATAMLFAREGAHLMLADINQATVTGVADTIQREGGQAIAVAVDVTKASDIQRMVQTAMDRFGRISIINTASGSALIATKNSAAYCASKGGVLALTRSVALDYAPTIRVNAICPGVVDTPAMHRILASAGDVDTLKAERGRSHPLGRLATPEEIAYGVLYLASDESSFTTGSPLIMDGGYTAQ